MATFITAGEENIEIPRAKVSVHFARSSGAGGQNVNKLNTKAEVRFHVEDADWMDNHTKARLLVLFGSFMNKEGEIIVTSQRQREQGLNLEDAFNKLTEMVSKAAQVPKVRALNTRLSELTKANYREEKQLRKSVKERRKSSPQHDDF